MTMMIATILTNDVNIQTIIYKVALLILFFTVSIVLTIVTNLVSKKTENKELEYYYDEEDFKDFDVLLIFTIVSWFISIFTIILVILN